MSLRALYSVMVPHEAAGSKALAPNAAQEISIVAQMTFLSHQDSVLSYMQTANTIMIIHTQTIEVHA